MREVICSSIAPEALTKPQLATVDGHGGDLPREEKVREPRTQRTSVGVGDNIIGARHKRWCR